MAIAKSKQNVGHAAGIFSDMTLDGPEIGTLIAVVDRAKNLPNRRTIGKQDPYCAMRLAKEAKKTNTDRRGGQTPRWDQELRFTVHDSPDYYKLKCSIFNDDKKTELIGEAWVDLTEVVKMGGGQGDFWQQLNYKGKYAGEIRIELTFYDTREQPQPQEKRKRDRSHTAPLDSSSDISLPAGRSLGPREIKRRPLPSSPAGPPPTQTPIPQQEPTIPQLHTTSSIEEQAHEMHAPVPLRPRDRSESPLPEVHHQQAYQAQPEDFEDPYLVPQQSSSFGYDHSEHRLAWHVPSSQHQDNRRRSHVHFDDQSYEEREPDFEYADQHGPPSTYPNEHEIWQPQRPQAVHTHSEPVTPQYSSPAYRPSPQSANSDSQVVRFHQHQLSESNAHESPRYSSSPLKQSMSHQDIEQQHYQTDVPPPLPPKHRETTPSRSRTEYPPSAYIPQPLRVGAKRSSISDRSPLQSLEDVYDPQGHGHPYSSPITPQRHSMYVQPHSHQPQTPDQQVGHYGRRQSSDIQPQPAPQSHQRRPAPRSRQNSYEIRNSNYNPQVYEEPQQMQSIDVHNYEYDDALQPTVEDAPPSPGLQPVIARKAVGAQPKKISGVPFAPDSYDVLNPASSPVGNEGTRFQTPEQLKEAQRLREVEKARNLGPIIGNDGREIDPSDHLPADTWAPEPERKNRKPEHVIHIRTRSDRPAGARASPIVVRNRGSTTASAQSSPAAIPSPVSVPNSSPAPESSRSWLGGRNRLQKSTPSPIRPLPTQPYASPIATAGSSPIPTSSPHEEALSQLPLQPRKPSYDNRVPPHLTRPSREEYQVPIGNAYKPRSDSYNSHSSPNKAAEYRPYGSPTKQPPQPYHSNYSVPSVEPDSRTSYDSRNNAYERRNSYDNRSDYSFENHVEAQRPQESRQQHHQQQKFYEDPLAAEMSMIDIGPSRSSYGQGSMGRSMAGNGARW